MSRAKDGGWLCKYCNKTLKTRHLLREHRKEEHDLYRQNYIIKELNCEFWRYDEKLGLLYRLS